MKLFFVVLLLTSVIFAHVVCGNDYLWGQEDAKDYLIGREKVKKSFVVGLTVSKKYIFSQKDHNPFTITAIKVTDLMKSNGATAELTQGGPGSKGATIKFKSQRGHGIKNLVEIWGR